MSYRDYEYLEHYPKSLEKVFGLWASLYEPEQVGMYDIFTLTDGSRILINEIRKIKKHAIAPPIWEFVDRDTSKTCYFKDLDYILEED